jgi:2-polyprenyl-6-methoxyphenol hydroxylase-like FAD-dependent oxidoreductase
MRALIAGGGIAGTVAAMALQKAGIEPVIFEAFAYGAEGVGAFLTLAVNGIEALGVLDVDVARVGGFETPRIALRLGSGQLLAELASGPDRPQGPVTRTLRRSELYGALRDEAHRRGIAIEYGKRLVGADTLSTSGVLARFADGSEAQGDVLVGADGLHSRVRSLIDPQAPRARYVGLLNAGGYADGLNVPGQPGTMQMFFGKRCFFCYVPVTGGEVWWFANPARSREPTKADLAAITEAQWRAELRQLFVADETPALEIIDSTPTITSGWATYDFPTVPHWHRDRMIIIGDAAHAASPSSGQGASMAIEDGIVLATCLRDEPTVAGAFTAYEKRRRVRVERVVAQGRSNGFGKTPGLFGRVLRDLALRVVFRRPAAVARSMEWVFDHRIDWDRDLIAS